MKTGSVLGPNLCFIHFFFLSNYHWALGKPYLVNLALMQTTT